MITNEERREVAARLREIQEDEFSSHSELWDKLLHAVGCWLGQKYQDVGFTDRIADLIESEHTCHWEWDMEKECWSCSNCGPMSPEDYYKIPSYCPECGAKTQF